MFVAVEHLLAEREERLRRNNIVFKHYYLISHGECPLVGEKSRRVAALVMVEILALHVALPVNLLIADNLPASLNARHVLWSTWTILIEEQSRGTRLAYFVEHKL